MRYFTIKVETATDGTESRDIRGFDTEAEAIVRFHSELAKYVNNTSNILEMLLASDGSIVKLELWEAPTEGA